MKRLWRNCKGMVTVLVTLLLVPSILVSGTAVDIARIYAARSIVQDANQLAANAALSEYDALLQDLYGLYGIMEDDPVLGKMLDDYIKISVLGQESRDQGLGTFQLLYGSEPSGGKVTAAPGQNLDNIQVLRRQIEEYAKLRAPVILTVNLLDRLEAFKNVKKDAEIIEEKMELDEDIEELNDKYEQLYQKISTINDYNNQQQTFLYYINGRLGDIQSAFKDLNEVREQWTEAFDAGDEDLASDHEAHFNAIKQNIETLVTGGYIDTGWQNGNYDDEGSWVPGGWTGGREWVEGLEDILDDADSTLDDQLDGLESLRKLCKQVNDEQKEIPGKVSDLRTSIDTKGSSGLKTSLTEPVKDGEGNVIRKSAMDEYEDLFQYDIEAMGNAVKEHNSAQINSLKEALADVRLWTNYVGGTGISQSDLKQLSRLPDFDINYTVTIRTVTNGTIKDRLGPLANATSYYRYSVPSEIKAFQDDFFASTKNPEFYRELERLCNNSENNAKKSKAKSAIKDVFSAARDLWDGATDYTPEGAWKYIPGAGSEETGSGDSDDLLAKDDWDEDATKDALDSSLVDKLANLGNDMANYVLLLTYDSEMFSCWSTPSKAEGDRKTMTGQTLSIENNYFYQSELEYLFAGNNNAQANLATVSGMILLVRFVFNYISAFRVTEVNEIVRAVRNACSVLTPAFGLVMGEAVRMAFALGESVVDLSRLRSGHKVALYKTDDTWRFSVTGVAEMITGEAESITQSTDVNGGEEDNVEGDSVFDDTELKNLPMTYEDYMRVFLLFVGGNTLAERTKNLIEFNVTHVKNNIGSAGDHTAIEQKMSETELVDLSKAMTGFSITTTVNLRMLFLSMPMARRGVNGVIPPGEVPISVTDYRGY